MTTPLISSTVRSYPKLPYEAMKNAVLGTRYGLSLTFIGERRARALNREYRQKDYAPNVLSFPLTNDAGEIYIAPVIAKREAKKFDMTYEGYVGFLCIHGLLHLKGLDHGKKMDALEAKYVRRFKLASHAPLANR